MLFRNCAGGIVFCGDQVLLQKNEKNEWVMPKGIIREGMEMRQVALDRVKAEAGVDAKILASAGETCYEFYSMTRGRPVCNRIQWFIMTAEQPQTAPVPPYTEAAFFGFDEALEKITYTQDRSLLAVSWEKYREIGK